LTFQIKNILKRRKLRVRHSLHVVRHRRCFLPSPLHLSFLHRESVSLTTAGSPRRSHRPSTLLLFKWRLKKNLIFISLLPSSQFLSLNPPLNLLLSPLHSISPFKPNRDSPVNRGKRKQSRPGLAAYIPVHIRLLILSYPPSAAAPSSSTSSAPSSSRCV
jgi:hypothetical protein